MINIVYMAYRRSHFSEVIFQTLSRCKFKDFHITVCGVDQQIGEFQKIVDRAKELGLSASLLIAPTFVLNYMWKIRAVADMDFEYSIKMDEDIFMGSQAWDWFFENIPTVLSNSDNLLLTPALSSGIPTIDYFMQNCLNGDQQAEMKSRLSGAKIPNLWGVYYDSLDNHLRDKGYHVETYYEAVKKVPHFYKGIHPIRVDVGSQMALNGMIMSNIEQFFEDREYEVEALWQPYFCNSFYAIKNDRWREVLGREDLFRDNFDEVTINLYRETTGCKFIVIRNTFAIHTCYNTLFADLPNDRSEIERQEDQLANLILQETMKR